MADHLSYQFCGMKVQKKEMAVTSPWHLLIMMLFLSTGIMAQSQVQTLRGKVLDQQSKNGIAGVTISITGTSLSTVSDASGSFVLTLVPLGRVEVSASHISYEPAVFRNILMEAGKETLITIELLESLGVIQDSVVVVAKKEKLAARQMATLSAFEFNAEDTRRFAGSRNDIARMASNFAGVNSVNDGRNDIIIRGNSPLGLLWRLEGIDIPNPNHFGSLGATGGPVGMLNNNVIGQSAFYTGAFPAQFGNATAGAFDLTLRNGNSAKKEFTAQVGFNGLELGAEGPFSKKSKASYLIYYRYSIPGLISSLGLDVGAGGAVPAYQDISMKVEMPTKKAGQFSLFALGGSSNIDFKGELKDTSNFYNDPYHNLYNAAKMGVIGLKHTYFFNSSSSTVFTLGATGSQVLTRQDSLDDARIPHKNYREDGREWRYMASLVFNKKFSATDRLMAGVAADQLHYNYTDSIRHWQHGFIPFLQEGNKTLLTRAYLQWQHRFSKRLTLNTGAYGQMLALNKTSAIDPRIGLRYTSGSGSAVTLAYGAHSQIQSLMTYFHETLENGVFNQTNRNLKFTKSHHIVAGYEQSVNHWKYKVEGYGQLLRNVPVEKHATNWSALNVGAGYGAGMEDSLVNEGTGYNYGLEFTAEKPFSKGYYALATLSLYDSRYKGSNGVQHHTVFNGRYLLNLLGGKEWSLNEMHTIAVDFKTVLAGGKRYTPIDLVASRNAGSVIYDDARSFELKTKDYFRLDIKLSYRMNNKKFMQEFFVDFQNVTNKKNVFSQWYDNRAEILRTQNQLGFWPNFNYRIQF